MSLQQNAFFDPAVGVILNLFERHTAFFLYHMSLPDGRYEYVSSKCAAVTGYDASDFYQNPLLIREILHPEWRGFFEKAWKRLLAGEMPPEYEYPIRDRAGKTRWLHQKNVLLCDASGAPTGIEGIVYEITAEVQAQEDLEAVIDTRGKALLQVSESLRKETAGRDQALAKARECETQLRVMADHLPAAISYVDSERRYRFVNATYQTWFGHEPAAVLGKTLWEVLGEAAYASIQAHVDTVLAGEDVTFEAPVPYERGGTRYVRASYVPHRDAAHGSVLGFFVLVSDISEEKAAEARERRHLLELAHVGRISTVGETASHIVHEMAQPLFALSAHLARCQTLMKKGDLGEIAGTIGAIENQLQNVQDVIRGFRGLLRREPGQRALVDVAHLISKAVALVRWEAETRGTPIEVQLADDLPGAMLDETMIGQVILNLLRNALDATDEPELRCEPIRVTAVRSGNAIEICIEDRGVGLSPDVKARLFEPFFTTKPEGVGIGLMISRRIVESHGGRLWAEEGPDGRGARFCFTVPAAS